LFAADEESGLSLEFASNSDADLLARDSQQHGARVITAASTERQAIMPVAANDGDDALARVPLFAQLTRDSVRDLEASATTARYDTATVVFRENDPAGDAYFIVDGQVEFEQAGEHVRTLGPGHALRRRSRAAARSHTSRNGRRRPGLVPANPVSTERKTRRGKTHSRQSVAARTVAVRGVSASSASSPKKSLGPSDRTWRPSTITSRVTASTT
jgi:hypothetical protein